MGVTHSEEHSHCFKHFFSRLPRGMGCGARCLLHLAPGVAYGDGRWGVYAPLPEPAGPAGKEKILTVEVRGGDGIRRASGFGARRKVRGCCLAV